MKHLKSGFDRTDRTRGVILLAALFALTSQMAAAEDKLAPGTATKPPRSAPAGSVVLNQHTLKDPGSDSMPSHTLLAPEGWKVEGSAFWAGANFFNNHPSQKVEVTSPDGVEIRIGPSIAAFDFLPSPQGVQFGATRPAEGTANNGFIVLHMPQNLQEWQAAFRNKFLPQTFPEATGIRVQPAVVVPEFTEIIQRHLAPMRRQYNEMNQQNRALGLDLQSHVDGAMLAVSSSYNLDGRKWEQLDLIGTTYFINDSPTGRQLFWGVEPNVTFRAPDGQLEANLPLLVTIGNSLQPTPQWARMKHEHLVKMNQIAAQGAAERSRIIADSNREISRIINEGWEQRQASLDRTHHRTINAIRGVDDFVTRDGKSPVQLPHNFQHVYTNGSQYILTNDPNYDPNRDDAVNNLTWDRMRRANPQP